MAALSSPQAFSNGGLDLPQSSSAVSVRASRQAMASARAIPDCQRLPATLHGVVFDIFDLPQWRIVPALAAAEERSTIDTSQAAKLRSSSMNCAPNSQPIRHAGGPRRTGS
jgi:hypothetical protein